MCPQEKITGGGYIDDEPSDYQERTFETTKEETLPLSASKASPKESGFAKAGSAIKGFRDRANAFLNGSGPSFDSDTSLSQKEGWKGVEAWANHDVFYIGNTIQARLAIKDSFLAWETLNPLDHNKAFRYELVMAIGENVIHKLFFLLSPQNISISVPNASTVTTTMKGIIEEHNGAPLRQIQINGTTGILPSETYKSSATAESSILNTLFGNTIKAGLNVVSQVGNVAKAIGGNAPPTGGPLNYTADEIATREKRTSTNNFSTDTVNGISETRFNFSSSTTADVSPKIQTGYLFAHNLARFLDYYMALKKNNAYKGLRLVLQMHKDKMYYNVLLNNYSINKSAATLEYNYSISLTAWKRRKGPIGTRAASESRFAPTTVDRVNFLASAFNTIKEARSALAAFGNLPDAVRADKNSLEDAMYEAGAFAGDLINAPKTFGLIFKHIKNLNLLGSIKQGFEDAQLAAELNDQLSKQLYKDNPAASEDDVGSPSNQGLAENAARDNESTDPLNDLAENPDRYLDLLDRLPLDSVQLPQSTNDFLDDEFDRINNLTAGDFIKHRDLTESFSNSMAEFFGGGSAAYNRVKGLPPPKKVYREPSIEDIVFLSKLNDFSSALDSIINTINSAEQDKAQYFNFYRDYALSNGINFSSAVSKFFVPFPYNSTLETLARAYLGNPDRWIEIAALNGLKAPYIDEEGTDTALNATGSRNSVTVPTSDDLYIGQVVEIFSDVQPKTKRHITSIDVINSIETLLQLDGEPNLALYKFSENAKMRHFKPHTVNSTMLIAIPSQAAPSVQTSLKVTPGVEDLNGLAQLAGVDFLLQSDGDLIFSSGGDIMLASGLTNLVQAAVLKLQTNLGSLMQHPTFGNPMETGMSTADLDMKDVAAIFNNQFAADHRFNGINGAYLHKKGPGVEAKFSVSVASSDTSFAVSTQLPL